MRKKFFLYLTDEEIILYRGTQEKLCSFKNDAEGIEHELQKFLSFSPKVPLCILIDRSHQYVREEKLPALLPWDRIRFLHHKKVEWRTLEGYFGFHFLKQKGEIYLRWIHVALNDFLSSWLVWAHSLPNPSGGIFFIPLEAGIFLKKHFSSLTDYQMLIYPVSSKETRHVIFKGKRLLLSRGLLGKEDIRSSLHFLSRSYPDIHEKLHILTLMQEDVLPFPHVKVLVDPQAFFKFLALQKRPSLLIQRNVSSRGRWLRVGGGVIFLSVLVATGITIYQGLDYQYKRKALLPKIEYLKTQGHFLESLLQNKDIDSLYILVL